MGVILRTRTSKKELKSYHLDINHQGKRYYENLGIKESISDSRGEKKEKLVLAKAIASLREKELLVDGLDYVPSSKKKVDFIKYYEDFLKNYKGKDKRIVKYSLEKFKDFYHENYTNTSIPIHKMDRDIAEKFSKYLKSDAGLNGETPCNYWTKFKKVIREAYAGGLIEKDICYNIKVTKDRNTLKKEVLTKEELQLLAHTYCGNETVKKAFLFACYTGLGIAEIRVLTWDQLRNGKLKINRRKTDKVIENMLPSAASVILNSLPKTSEHPFPNLPSDPAIYKLIRNWVKKADIDKKISFYCARHTFACLLLIGGANLKTVADCLGHYDTRHTHKYLNYVDSLKEEALINLPELKF